MIVALDGTPLAITSGGLRRYTEELFRALRTQFPDDRYMLVSDQLERPLNPLGRRWWSIGLPLKLARTGCSVFHGTNFSVPYLPLRPAVMSVHDISPWMNREWHHHADRVRRRSPMMVRLGLAAMLIVPTEAVRRQVIELFQAHPNRVAVVPYAGASELHASQPYSSRPYFLFVGTVEPRKNVPALVEAWRSLRSEHDVELVIAGRRREDGPAIPAEPGLKVLGEVDDQQLMSLYSGAVALVYPSAYEGFGLPVLEAMQCGAAVIASRDPALMEVSGGAAIHTDAAGLPRTMRELLTNLEELGRRRELSLRRAREFSWERTAAMTREVYAEAIRRSGR